MSYDLSAQYYDLIYEAKKNYRAEAESLHRLVQARKQSDGRALLDVACGTGLHAQYLREWYDVDGLDQSEAQLAIARRRLPRSPLFLGNMVDFNLGEQFDVVTCLFGSIGYLVEADRMRQAIANMGRHLRPGGVLVVEPWLHPGDFRRGHIGIDQAESSEMRIVRIGQTRLEGRITHLREHHFVSRPGQDVKYFVEDHALALYTADEYLAAFRSAGLEAWHDLEGLMGRGLFIGRKPL